MQENWMNENLCSFDEKTRIELAPQLIELMCNSDNLKDSVTSPHYSLGRIDALGKVITEGKMMTCVDWRQKHKPKIWKIYKMDGGIFIKIKEDENKINALKFASKLAGEM